jgi:N6-adenosine-specific RNA methylase IME4
MTKPFLFAPLERRAFDLIAVDPPWSFKTWSLAGQGKSASKHYPTMSLERIQRLPVRELLKDDGHLLLWATAPMWQQAEETLKAWGATFKTEVVWRKITSNGKVRIGCGFRARTAHEPILVATYGHPRVFCFPCSVIDGIARQHSRKPREFYDLVTALTPGFRRAEIFARERRLGWAAWGNELDKFAADRPTADETAAALAGDGCIEEIEKHG